jgi:hypothetical protein
MGSLRSARLPGKSFTFQKSAQFCGTFFKDLVL